MEDQSRRRLSSQQAQRIKTLRKRYTPAELRAKYSKAGKASPTKFNTSRSHAANRARWAKYYAAHPDKLKEKIANEKLKEELKNERLTRDSNRNSEQNPVVPDTMEPR